MAGYGIEPLPVCNSMYEHHLSCGLSRNILFTTSRLTRQSAMAIYNLASVQFPAFLICYFTVTMFTVAVCSTEVCYFIKCIFRVFSIYLDSHQPQPSYKIRVRTSSQLTFETVCCLGYRYFSTY